MKRVIIGNTNYFEFAYSYTVIADNTGNRYNVIANGHIEDDSMQIRITRAISNGKKQYAYALIGQKPGEIDIWYKGELKYHENFGLFKNYFDTSKKYFQNIVEKTVDILDAINEEIED